ncbi:metal-dependent hydrolase [Halomonas urumqiensis]|uniref:Hydrolase n=1 Tax=Halomonas urumqiensis TaxID=1684789 RepID=A0A2N7UF17_9GAMM|nr:metal-dependent hydrolase [Halomonas urumqiensis]PMR78975.1 hydrolase [Halomonas urumqiensis]PTB00969.1 metal-dependent hydrolase [Halomonas urumqiensis]GHE22912.1 integral membrane protein [Halomonas urumqiensis]
MDSITQAALGGAIGGAVLGRRLGRKAVLIGAALGTLPDLDVILDYGDAIANVTEHRGFSHSLFVLTGLATLLALLARRFAPARDIPLSRWWLFCGLILMTHPLLDALTTYGTQIWWPLDVRPAAYPIVFIIDPLYTLPLLVGIGVAMATGNGLRAPRAGLALATAYLVFAFGAKLLVEHRIEPVLAAQGLAEAPRLVQPTPFNTLLWRVTVVDGVDQHETLVGVFDGDSTPQLETFSRGAEREAVALQSEKGQRLDWFAGPFLRYESASIDGQETLVATDLRLGFPGFYPFSFTLATREADEWQPLMVTQQLEGPSRGNREALARLGKRILAPTPLLCTSDFVPRQWLISRPSQC